MTVLVTGAGGFLGGHVVRRLVAAGVPVRGLDLTTPMDLPSATDWVEGSVLDADLLAKAFQGVDRVIHAAAIAALWSPGRFDFDRVNVVGTCRVLAEARRAGARTVLVSSYTTLVGRDTLPGARLDETIEVVPNRLLGLYPRSKRQAELAALAAAAAGQPVTIVLPSAPVGAGDINLTPPAKMLADLAAGRTPALLDCTLNLVDVAAVADTVIAALDRGKTGQRYLLSGEDIRMRDLATLIAGLGGKPAPRATVPLWLALAAARAEALVARVTKRPPTAPLTGVRLAARPCLFDNTRAREELGFAPRPLRTALAEALVWLREAGHVQG